jgi:hypothetical protein
MPELGRDCIQSHVIDLHFFVHPQLCFLYARALLVSPRKFFKKVSMLTHHTKAVEFFDGRVIDYFFE